MKKYTYLSLIFAVSFSCSTKKQQNETNEPINAFVSLETSLETTTKFPSFDPKFPPPTGASEVFELSQDYPSSYEVEDYPWKTVDFTDNPNEYGDLVLKYCLEGNLNVDFKGQVNPIRKWYHAPWLHSDGEDCGNGREYIHGLTRERSTPKFEIHRNQDVVLENWAVGMYNAPGGVTMGKVWLTEDGIPNPRNSDFPEGTVTFKLLFTNGAVDKVPFLDGTFEWTANIYEKKPYARENGQKVCVINERVNTTVRLLQIDIAIKDSRSPIGWVFGTFMYNASNTGESAWDRMELVGLSWGDDPNVTKDLTKDGAFINADLEETYLNASLLEDPINNNSKKAYVLYHGLGGRLNGPVDNPISSCISCHGQAATFKDYSPLNSNSGRPMPMANFRLKRANFPTTEFEKYFANASAGANDRTFNNVKYITTDYSLQLAAGIRNFYQNLRTTNVSNAETFIVRAESKEKALESFDVDGIRDFVESLPDVNRGEED